VDASKHAFGLPCPSTPLQSITAAASRRFLCRAESSVKCAGQEHRRSGLACCASGTGVMTRGSGIQLLWRCGERARHVAGVDRNVRGGCHSQSVLEPKLGGPIVASPEGGVTGEWLRRELRDIDTEVRMSRVLRVVERRRSGGRRGGALRVLPGDRSTEVVGSVRRTDRRLPRGCDPPRWSGRARHAAGKRRHLPWGSAPFGEISSGGRYAGLPSRRHPSSEFLTLSTV